MDTGKERDGERMTGEGLHRRRGERGRKKRRRKVEGERVDIKYAWTDASSHSSLPFLLPSVSLFLFLLHLVSIISPSFIPGAGFPSPCSTSPLPHRLRSDLLALSPFFPAVQLAPSVLHAPQEFTYSRVPARLAHGTPPTPALESLEKW